MPGPGQDSFDIGFALSGAISAGAYTAGVLDYFLQALEAWEQAKRAGTPGTPPHGVNLQVITGASAGAITGALGVVALARGFRPQALTPEEERNTYPTVTGTMQHFRCMLPSLYETWVTRPRMVDPAGGIDFLSSEDLDRDKSAQVVSALNAALLDEIKDRALSPPATAEPPRALPPYPYIAENLHVYMTVSNLRGIPFEISFGNSTYGMQTHGDRGHYVICGLGRAESAENSWLAADSTVTLEIGTLPKVGQSVPAEWDRYGTCALASSAFPIGLAPRELDAPLEHFEKRSYPIERGGAALKPKFPGAPPGKLGFLNVDGGVINNNPFDYAQFALMGDQKPKGEETEAKSARRAVIMVSPFPEPPAFLPEGQPPAELVAVLRALFPALINQTRFKASEIVPALNPEDHSRFLIAPHRAVAGLDGEAVEQKYKIACGLLGGFGGFLDEKFRAHDFQLGRRNSQRFLATTFGLTPDNRVVQGLKDQQDFELAPGAGQYRIIPRLGDALPEVALPKWPQMSQPDFNLLMRRIKARLGTVGPRFVQAQTASRFLRALGRIGLRFGRDRILESVERAILADLVRRDQIDGWELQDIGSWRLPPTRGQPADDVRLVIAELVSPAFTFRTAEGIAAKTHLDRGFVADVLDALQQADKTKPYRVWRGTFERKEVFTLASRRPRKLRMVWGFRQAANFFELPSVG